MSSPQRKGVHYPTGGVSDLPIGVHVHTWEDMEKYRPDPIHPTTLNIYGKAHIK